MSQISIILPTYNVEKYIARALESCINQTFKDIEIIVVDDCGNDKSIDIAKEYASKDDRIKIIHNEENLKLLRARYEGAKVATSPYIMFLDSDDYLELNACEECIKILDMGGGGKIDLLCFEAFITNAKKSIKKLNIKQGKYNNKEFTMQILKTKNPFWTMWAKIIKKDIYLKAFNMLNLKKEIKINMAEDALLYYPLTILSNEIFYLTQPLYTQHVNSNSITNNINSLEANIQEHKIVLNVLKSIKNKKTPLYFLIIYLLKIQLLKYEQNFNKRNINLIYYKINILYQKYQFKWKKFLYNLIP
ncbi:beta-1,3 galactosyltransferase [Campylobacter jejuni]|uniref:Beta-1,3 galactosyltransferase n=26 Tax=Campylobacter jejuni TaxID=197 RepID=Q0P9B5_CAMJE|nr:MULTISPECIES: beta-1,3 galactosyltransferase [Campylobacter]YP_002344532.1 beta-1,3 galactosyltransferase [Campylobacter jejuni subsp. jejuni NCTC 11168 = ATCC 700819]APA81384.1 Beta-1,3-galactosyltransferase / Beta-1,4-galactosyltransferase [Campylobacter jejuni subsp. jejuni D42a]ADC28719.1 beta-1,3 galactosyltransferase [Campylobacter jejuni subsp. jejuni IA3902]AGV49743.2 beta-1,3 galactosyltransferase [Campylobacter jejuni subsp. jejuni 00-2538]AGV56909.1 beta-1,3 galactosyltransferase